MESYKCLVKVTKDRRKSERQNRNKKGNKWKTITNVVYINPTISIITLNINGQNTLITQRLSH